MSKARAEIEVTASSNKLAAGLNSARAKFQTFSSALARGVASTMRGAMAQMGKIKLPTATASHAIGSFAGGMLSKGVDVMIDAAQGVRAFERDLMRLGLSAKRTPEQLDELRKAFRATSVATGVDSGKIAEASRAYFDLTSDAEHMSVAMNTAARVAQASDSDIGDIVKTMAKLSDAMHIEPGDMESAMSGLMASGDAGQIGLKDMAAEFPKLLASFQKFGTTGREGVMQVAAAWQVGAKAFGDGSESATGLMAMMAMLQSRQKELANAGVQVYTKNAKGVNVLRNLHDIIRDIGNKKIDAKKYKAIFGDNQEARRFLDALLAAPGAYDAILAASNETGAVTKNLATIQESSSGKIEASLNRVKELIAEAFTPERIEKFAEMIERAAKAVGVVVDALKWAKDQVTGETPAMQNPYSPENQEANQDDSMIGAIMPAIGAAQTKRRGMMSRETRTAMARLPIGHPMRAQAITEMHNEKAYNKTYSGIEGQSSRTKKVRAAVEAWDYSAGGGETAKASADAGGQYIKNEKVSQAEIQAARDEIAKLKAEKQATDKNAVEHLGPVITDAMAKGFAGWKPPILQIGDNPVAAATVKATNVRATGGK